MINICAYYNYEIIWQQDGSYIDDENSLPNDIVFGKYETENKEIINGGKLLEKIAKLLNNNNICEFYVKEDEIMISHFNPTNGTSDNYTIIINELKEEGK